MAEEQRLVRVAEEKEAARLAEEQRLQEKAAAEAPRLAEEQVAAAEADEEWTDDEVIPVDTGINNSDIEGAGDGESIDSTEMELQEA